MTQQRWKAYCGRNLYDAIMKAANHIEMHPRRFDFDSIKVPKKPTCGTPGCAIGWVAHFGKFKFFDDAAEALGGDTTFYVRMNALDPPGSNWMRGARECARTLRMYAEKYHAHEKATPPDWSALARRQTVPDGPIRSPEYAG